MKTIAFIDAGQLRPAIVSQRIQVGTKKRFDWTRFKTYLERVAGDELFDTHYFDCVSDAPSAGREAFHQFLRSSLGFQLHFSELKEKKRNCPLCESQYIEHEQKGIDVSIAVHMLRLAYCDAFDQAVLCSGDGEYASLVNFMRDALGKRVHVIGWHHGIAPGLRDVAYKLSYLEDAQDEILGSSPEKEVSY